MAAGLQVWNEYGQKVVDTSDYFLKTTSIDVGEVSSPGSIDLSSITNAGGIILPLVSNLANVPEPVVTASLTGTLSWQKQNSSAPDFRAKIKVCVV